MLQLSIHAGPLDEASRYNQLAKLAIVYERLSPVADYKLALIERGMDVQAPRTLSNYPRWSASLWDLAARALAICLPEAPPDTERIPDCEPGGNRCAFIREMTVILDHAASDVKNTLGTVSIKQAGRRRGIYQASFVEHTMKPVRTEPFVFAPAYFRPAELLLHACLYQLSGELEFPARPGLCAPTPVELDGLPYVPIHQLVEPARTGFRTWLNWFSEPAREYPGAPYGIAPQPLYVKFLQSAI
jgi:hypothetical protein